MPPERNLEAFAGQRRGPRLARALVRGDPRAARTRAGAVEGAELEHYCLRKAPRVELRRVAADASPLSFEATSCTSDATASHENEAW